MSVSPTKTQYNPRQRVDVTIANGQSLSTDAADIGGYTLVGILMPSTWTAADLTFQAGVDDASLSNLYEEDASSDTERVVQAAASRFIALKPTNWIGIHYLKVRSGTSGSPVSQGGARTITLILAP